MTVVARDVRADDRGRIALGRALKDLGDATFDVYRDDAGRIVLDPRVSIPASEAWVFRNETALASLRRGLPQAAEGKTRVIGAFAAHADDDESTASLHPGRRSAFDHAA